MAIRRQVSAPVLNINNKNIAYEPNSLKFHDGSHAERKVTNLTSGGRSRTKLIATDASTLNDFVSFDLEMSAQAFDLINEWQDASDVSGVGIRISEGTSVWTFRNMVIQNKPEFNASVDGRVTIEFA